MSGFKDIVKKGWHPEKDVPIKDSLAGLVGKGNKKEENYRTPAPISSLRDPASFPPPPKHIATGATLPPPPPGQPYRPPSAGTANQSYTSAHTPAGEPAAEEAPAAPRPYRVDTTGLSTSNLPPPPRRTGCATPTPTPPPSSTHVKPPPPSLPPRLPPRTASPAVASVAHPPPPPVRTSQLPAPAKPQGYLNQSAINNLSSKGISVPGLGIGSFPSPSQSLPHPVSSQNPTPSASGPTHGTTWAQKRAAVETASSLHRDPSSISASDAASAASTIHNFHQRHGDQVGSVAARANALAGSQGLAGTPAPATAGTTTATPSSAGAGIGKKKPPPPPPSSKKPELSAARPGSRVQEVDAPPPPVPLATRPKF